MDAPIVGGLLAFLGGAAIAALNFYINLRTLRRKPQALASMSMVRQVLNVGYLVAVFLLAKVLPWDYIPLLVGAAVGLTVPAFLLSLYLAKLNDAKSVPAESEKGEETNE